MSLNINKDIIMKISFKIEEGVGFISVRIKDKPKSYHRSIEKMSVSEEDMIRLKLGEIIKEILKDEIIK